mgnify:CR=1 FL=1
MKDDLSDWEKKGDYQITKALIEGEILKGVEALIIRTLPNEQKQTKDYNNTNWPSEVKFSVQTKPRYGVFIFGRVISYFCR